MIASLKQQLWAVIQQEELEDPSWVLELEGNDEPPLFTRDAQVEFLRDIPAENRGPALLEIALLLMQGIAKRVATEKLPSERRIFCCVTFTDFEEWRQQERLVPTPCLYAEPHQEKAPASPYRFTAAFSPHGHEVVTWLSQLDPKLAEPFCVAELDSDQIDPELRRVYVGWKVKPSKHLEALIKDS